MFKTLLLVFLLQTTTAVENYDVYGLEDAARKADIEEPDVVKLFAENEGFRNLTYNGVPKTRVVGIISAVTAGFSILKAVAGQIDVGRVCAVGLSNHGNRKLVEPTWYLEAGIIHDPLPREIAPGDAGVFTFEKTSYSTYGTAGILTYTVEGTNLQVEVLWSVPMLYGPYSNRFNVKIARDDSASSLTYNSLYDTDYQEVSNGGHWMHRNLDGVKVHAAMTNNAKASLLVEVFYNITSPVTDIFGK